MKEKFDEIYSEKDSLDVHIKDKHSFIQMIKIVDIFFFFMNEEFCQALKGTPRVPFATQKFYEGGTRGS